MQINTGIIRRCEQSFLRERLSYYRLKPVDSVVLHALQKCGSCNQEKLCAAIDIDKGRMARVMERLEERGLIHRIVNPSNKREKLIATTDQGVEMLSIIQSFFQEWNERCFAGFTPEERAQYENYMERIAKNALAGKEHNEHD